MAVRQVQLCFPRAGEEPQRTLQISSPQSCSPAYLTDPLTTSIKEAAFHFWPFEHSFGLSAVNFGEIHQMDVG